MSLTMTDKIRNLQRKLYCKAKAERAFRIYLLYDKICREDFLGYSFGAHRFEANGNWYLGASPSKKSVQRLKTRIGDLLVPSNIDPWPEVCDKLNRSLRGWSNYFGYGSRSKAYRSVDQYVFERVRRFLARRHKVQGRGNRRFTFDVIHRALGVLCLQRLPRAVPSCPLRWSQSESRMPEIGSYGL